LVTTGGVRRRQIIGVDAEAPADLVLGHEILRQFVLRRRSLVCDDGRKRDRGSGERD
jgi:hypothetical protein